MTMPMPTLRVGIRKPNSAGLVTVTGTAGVPAADLLHTLGTNRSGVRRSAIVRKIIAYNNTGGNVPFQLGTVDLAVAPAFVQLIPDFVAINGFDNIWTEEDITRTEFTINRALLAAGRAGDIYISSLGVLAGMTIVLEVEEFGS